LTTKDEATSKMYCSMPFTWFAESAWFRTTPTAFSTISRRRLSIAIPNTVIVVEHEMRVVASSDWVIDMGPGAGDEGGQVVATGTPADVARAQGSRTAAFLAAHIDRN
jgi:hypothetical protein